MKERKISLVGAISIGIGGMVGGGIFAVLGEAVSLAHGATAFAFAIAGFIAILTAYSYAKLSVAYQDSGGTAVFISKAFNGNIFSSTLNVFLWLSYLVTISLYASAFASYAQIFFTGYENSIWLRHILISVAIILPALINIVSASFVSKSESAIVITKILFLLLIIFVGMFQVDITKININIDETLSIITAGMIIFVAYEGFELIANTSANIKNPNKNLPRAFYISVGSVIFLYIAISIITVGSVDEKTLMEAKDYALAIAVQPTMGKAGFIIVAIAAILSTFSAIIATVYGNARLGAFLAKKSELPKTFSKKHKDIPMIGVVAVSLFSLILANSMELKEVAIVASGGFLLIFTTVNLSAIILRKQIGANTFITILATILSLISLVVLMLYTYLQDIIALYVFVGFLFFSCLISLFYKKTNA